MENHVSPPPNKPVSQSPEEWLTLWGERAIPIYVAAFHAFMTLVNDKKTNNDDNSAESNAFYDALTVTLELCNYLPSLHNLRGEKIPTPIYDVIEELVKEITDELESVKSRCVVENDLQCIAPADLMKFLNTLVNFICEIGYSISAAINAMLEPFNNFMSNFDQKALIDLVDGEYHMLVSQESEERAAKIGRLSGELNKLIAEQQAKTMHANTVFVIFEKADIIQYVQNRWADFILMTPHAIDSLLCSGFKDLKSIVAAFDLLGQDFYNTYTGNQRMESAKAAAETLKITFKPKMSETGMGTHPVYNREYSGRSADFNRHLCLGTSRKAEHCMRIHFEWDEAIHKIVVHHAGNHLPTSRG